MNLARAAAAGRPVRVGARLLLLSPPSLRGVATMLAFLRRHIPHPEGKPPGLAHPDADALYATPEGQAVLLWVAAHRDQPNLTIDECEALAAQMDDAAMRQLADAVFVREAGMRPTRFRKGVVVSKGPGKGIEEVDFGVAFGSESINRFPPDVLAELTIDQFEIARFGTEMLPDDELTPEEVREIWLEGRRVAAERKAAAQQPPTEAN